jgi:hypothetical protein
MRALKAVELKFKEIPWIVSRGVAGVINPEAATFCQNLMSNGYEAAALVNVMPRHRLIYIAVPKAASTRIRRTLAKIEGRFSRSLKPRRRTMYRGPYGPRNFPIGLFYQVATAPDVMRFSFVRNPYARVVSCWADKFAGKPLIGGDRFIDAYLSVCQQIDPQLPIGAERTLSFPQFTVFTAATSKIRHDIHMQTQDDILSMPGIELNLIGKVENFDADFVPILDYLNASEDVRREASTPLNESHHDDWPSYYTPELADRIYRAYEPDFDRFGYVRAIGNPPAHRRPTENGAAMAGDPVAVRS